MLRPLLRDGGPRVLRPPSLRVFLLRPLLRDGGPRRRELRTQLIQLLVLRGDNLRHSRVRRAPRVVPKLTHLRLRSRFQRSKLRRVCRVHRRRVRPRTRRSTSARRRRRRALDVHDVLQQRATPREHRGGGDGSSSPPRRDSIPRGDDVVVGGDDTREHRRGTFEFRRSRLVLRRGLPRAFRRERQLGGVVRLRDRAPQTDAAVVRRGP